MKTSRGTASVIHAFGLKESWGQGQPVEVTQEVGRISVLPTSVLLLTQSSSVPRHSPAWHGLQILDFDLYIYLHNSLFPLDKLYSSIFPLNLHLVRNDQEAGGHTHFWVFNGKCAFFLAHHQSKESRHRGSGTRSPASFPVTVPCVLLCGILPRSAFSLLLHALHSNCCCRSSGVLFALWLLFIYKYFIKFKIIHVLWPQCIYCRDANTEVGCKEQGDSKVTWMLLLSSMDNQGVSVFYRREDWAYTQLPEGLGASFFLRAETVAFHSSWDVQVLELPFPNKSWKQLKSLIQTTWYQASRPHAVTLHP